MAKCVTRTLNGRARLWVMVAGFGFGCASQTDETKRQLETLNERILILQNDRDRLVERVDALEQHGGRPVAVAPVSAATTRPMLTVVRLAPEVEDKQTQPEAAANEPTASESEPGATVELPSEHPALAPAESPQRVVLYGEGQVSGVREPKIQELP